jgi:eukaryotic-like serine/threonine-protein kinase
MASPRLISHYEILAPLGSGGMGEVYVAFDTVLQRKVALKAVRQDRLDDEARARLLREARILSQLDHPAICRVYDYVAETGTDYLVLELIEGRSLRDAMRAGMDPPARMRVAEQVAAALVAAHAAGIVHRDLKPENIMLLPDGSAKVLDFGIARAFDAEIPQDGGGAPRADVGALFDGARETIVPASSGIFQTHAHVQTIHGVLIGSPAYMSPEQARGEAATSASDMYGFGLLLQELFTGRAPYGDTRDVPTLLDKARRADIADPAGIDRDLAALIRRLEAQAPSQRPTAVDAVERLHWIRGKKRRFLQYVAGAAVLAFVVTGFVKYTIDLQRERTAAVLARTEAMQRRDQAEGLIGFMLGDLRAKLQRVGRLDVLDDVGQRAMAYFAAVPPDSITDQELYRRSQAIHQIGQVRMTGGDLKGGTALFRESLDLITRVAQRNPANAEWQIGLATSHFYLGDALRLQGDLDGATRHFMAYRDIAQGLVARDPTKPEWLLEASYGHSNVSGMLEARGDLDGARRETELSLAIKQRLVAAQPNNREWQEALATGHNRLAIVLEKLGDARGALEHHLEDFAVRKALADKYPQDKQAQRKLADTASYVGMLYRDQGDDARALEYHQLRLSIIDALVRFEPANADWQREAGMAEARMSMVQRLRGDLADASARAERAVAILRPLAMRDPTHTRRQRDAGDAGVELALVRLARRADAAALAEAETAATALAAVVAKTPNDPEARRLLAEAHLVAAEAWRKRGLRDRARQSLEHARDVIEPIAAKVRERRLQKTWALVLLGLGRASEAQPVIASLRATGFRSFTQE